MELRHLTSFLVLCEERHFGRAAQHLHIAQPALSQQLKQLERAVGTRLVDRSTRRMELTEAGLLLRARATEILADVERTTTDLSLLARGRAGRVRLGFVGTATYDVLPRVARRLREELPDLELELHGELLGPELLDRLRSGDLDIAVLRLAGPASDGLQVTPLRTEPLVAVLPAHHRLAGNDAVDLADLADEVLITHPSGRRSVMQPLVLGACRGAGFEPRVLEVGETGTLVVFVAAGLGVGLVPEPVRALRLDGVAYVALRDPVAVQLALAHAYDTGAVVRTVAAVVQATMT
ncbi:MAG TPA: LysR substrate-binding domain-containing protein [Ornithinimicrobium sp.]|uniref:LysR family transcriptional regulator n=1 Tax=Ornithinimicrobium sp. TaxID=1977084 RepID=UPI002B4901E9|nr:LysR substrate-binding domain-containing protein [Ornithinimicrobium sp.]HKJ10806.1 LysR substrate-binding domain-containing protein [Ornithinimicrobium sp.]